MQVLHEMNVDDLVDLLAEQTTNYYKLLSKGATRHEQETLMTFIGVIQSAINSRKQEKESKAIRKKDKL